MFSKALNFAKRDVWRIQAKNLPRGKFYLLQFLRITILTLRGLTEDKVHLGTGGALEKRRVSER